MGTENIEKSFEQDVTCEVKMDGKTFKSDDFVAILSKENGDASIFYNTDALTLGMAVKMICKSFVESMQKLSEEEQREIAEVLGDAFVWNKPEEAVTNA